MANTSQLQTLAQHKALQRKAHDVSIRLKFPEQFSGEPSMDRIAYDAAELIRHMAEELWSLKPMPDAATVVTHNTEQAAA